MSSRKIVETKIVELKAEGKSLREIASIFGISHEGVRKRLKGLDVKNRVSTQASDQELTASTRVKEKVSNLLDAHKLWDSKETRETVNRVSTLNTPSPTFTEGVNPLGTPADKPPGCKKREFQGVLSGEGDLFESIKEFLELNGVELYRMQVEQETYQVKHNGQVIRIYVQRKMEEPKSKGER